MSMGILAWACVREPMEPPPPVTQGDYSALRVTVRHIYATQPAQLDSVVPHVAIELYRSAQDRKDQINRYQQRVTDTSGEALFGRVKDDTYYILALSDSLGAAEDVVSVEGGALELKEVLYLP